MADEQPKSNRERPLTDEPDGRGNGQTHFPERNRHRFNANEAEWADHEPASVEYRDDIADKIMRGILALGGAVFTSAIVAGMLEVARGWEIEFGSLPMIGITLLFYLPWYKALTYFGFFRSFD